MVLAGLCCAVMTSGLGSVSRLETLDGHERPRSYEMPYYDKNINGLMVMTIRSSGGVHVTRSKELAHTHAPEWNEEG
jgi:hypothetical protein